MHRFFVQPDNILGDEVVLSGSDVSHIRTVLRLQEGSRIQVLDGLGNRYFVQLTSVQSREVRGRVESKEVFQTESPLSIHMGMALLKGNKFDSVLRKSVELGVGHVSPLKTDRSIIRVAQTEAGKKTARWQKIAREAARQSGRSRLPEVAPAIQTVAEFCQDNRTAELKLIFWEEEEACRLKDVSATKPPRSIAFLSGPEGGFSSEEIETARQNGFQSVTLGPRILRAETAPIVILSILQNRWGDL
jgi:16S rRNA (uracil1498-N3)-methyltransferase